MAKWQLTVEKNGIVLEKHGGCSKYIKQRFANILGYLLATNTFLPHQTWYTITISKYTSMKHRKKKIVQLLTLEQKAPAVKRLVDFNLCSGSYETNLKVTEPTNSQCNVVTKCTPDFDFYSNVYGLEDKDLSCMRTTANQVLSVSKMLG